MTSPLDLWRSGLVQRWHANPDLAWTGQTLAAHQWGCAVLLKQLFPLASGDALFATLTHDIGEMIVGDLPAPFKNANPVMAAQHAAFEKIQADKIRGSNISLTSAETDRLKLVDMLEAYLWVAQKNPAILDKDGWPEMRAAILELAVRKMPAAAIVTDLIEAAERTS